MSNLIQKGILTKERQGMTIRSKIKAILSYENSTFTELAAKLSARYNKKIEVNSISQKLIRNTIKYVEVDEILDVLGYDIVFQKRKN